VLLGNPLLVDLPTTDLLRLAHVSSQHLATGFGVASPGFLMPESWLSRRSTVSRPERVADGPDRGCAKLDEWNHGNALAREPGMRRAEVLAGICRN